MSTGTTETGKKRGKKLTVVDIAKLQDTTPPTLLKEMKGKLMKELKRKE